jgi:hypothetical protein
MARKFLKPSDNFEKIHGCVRPQPAIGVRHCKETPLVPLGHPRRIFARAPNRFGRVTPWLVMAVFLACASAAAGAMIAVNAPH